MPNDFLRPIGKPVVEKATNGLRKITRRYVVHGPSSAEPTVETLVFQPFCTPDEEYGEALLVQQKLEGSQDASQDVLTRVYQEVNDLPAEIDPPDYIRDGIGRVRVTKSYIVKEPYNIAWSEARVGTEKWVTPNGDETVLARVTFDEKECYAEYKEEYFEIGIVSFKEEVKYNGKLKIRTYRSIGIDTQASFLAQAGLAPDWVLVESMSGSGSTDYNFGGLEVKSWTLVKGAGRIIVEEEDKGPTQITTEVIIVADGDPYTPHSTIPPNQIYETREEDKDGYDLWTIKGVVGQGEIDRKHEVRYNGALEIITIKNIGAQSTVPVGFVRISEDHDQSGSFDVFTDVYVKGLGLVSREEEDKGTAQITTEIWITPDGGVPAHGITPNQIFETKLEEKDGYEIHTIRGVVGQGEIERRLETKHNGALTVLTIKNIGAQSTAPVGYVRISENFDQSGRFDVFTDVYVKGSGLVSSSQEDKGTAQITTEVHITVNGGTPASNIPPTQVFQTRVEEKDGYEIHTISGVIGSGEIERKEETKHNGALSVIRIQNIGQQSAVPAGYDRISQTYNQSGQFDVFTDVYVKGLGLISTEEEDKGTAQLATEVHIVPNGGTPTSNIPTNQIFETKVDERDGYEIHTIRGVVGAGEIDRKLDVRHNGALEVLTIQNIGQQSAVPNGYVRVSEKLNQSGRYDVFTDVYAKGAGLISSTEEEKGLATITTEVWLTANGGIPTTTIPQGQIYRTTAEEKDGYEVHTIVGVQGQGEIDRKLETRKQGALQILTIQSIGAQAPNQAGFTRVSERSDRSGNFEVFTDVYALGAGRIQESKSTSSGDTIRTTVTYLMVDDEPAPQGCVTAQDIEDLDGYVLYKKTYTSSANIPDLVTSTRSDQYGIFYPTVSKTGNAPPVFPNSVAIIAKRETRHNCLDGANAVTEYEYTFAVLPADLEVSKSVRMSGQMKLTDITAINNMPAQGGCVTAESDKSLYDVDGSVFAEVFSKTFAEGVGVVDESVSTSNGITRRRKKTIGAAPVGGCVVAKNEEQIFDLAGAVCETLYDYTFLEGAGEMERSVSSSGGVTKTRIKQFGGIPANAGCVVAKSEEQIKDVDGGVCDTIYDYTFVEGAGEISRSVSSSGGVTKTRIRAIGAVPQGDGCLVAKGEEEVQGVDGACYTIYEYTFAEGAGELERSTSTSGGVTKERVKTIGAAPQGNGCIVAKSEEEINGVNGKCFSIFDYTFASGAGELERSTSTSAGLTRTRIKAIGAAPTGNGCTVAKREEVTKSVDGADCLTIYDYEFLASGQGEVERSVKTNGGLTVTRIKAIGARPGGNGCLTAEGKEEIKDIDGGVCVTIYTAEYTSGQGELDRSVTSSDGITFTRIKKFGGVPAGGTCVTQRSTETVYDIKGGACDAIETRTFMMWQTGVISRSTRTGPDNMLLTTVVSTNKGGGRPAGGCTMGEETKEFRDADGALCFTRYTSTYGSAPAAGEIERTTRSGGGKSITSIKSVGQVPVGKGCQTGESKKEIKDIDGAVCFSVYTAEFTVGTGIIDNKASTRSDGGVEITVRAIGAPPAAPAGGCMLAEAEEGIFDKDGVQCDTQYTYTFLVPPSGHIISESTSTNSNGVTTTTVVGANIVPIPPNGGCVVGKGEKQINDMGGNPCYSIYTREFATGEGVIRTSVRTSGGLTYKTIKSVGQAPAGQGCLTSKSEIIHEGAEDGPCYTVYEYEYLENISYRILSQSVNHGSNGIKKTTTKTLEAPFIGAGCKVAESSYTIDGINGTCATVYETETIEGTGEYDRSVSTKSGYSEVTIRSIGQPPQAPAGNRCLLTSSEVDVTGMDGTCFKKYVYTYIIAPYGKVLSTRTRWSDGVLYTTTRQMDQAATATGCKVSEAVEEIHGENGVCLSIYETTYAEGDGEIDRSVSNRGGVVFTTIKSIGQPPQGQGCLWSKSEVTRKGFNGTDCYTIYTYTFAKGYGEVSRTSKTDGCGITYTTIESIDQAPNGAGRLMSQTESTESGGEGPCFTRYKYTFVDDNSAVMLIVTQYRTDGSVVYTESAYNQQPARQGKCLMETRMKCDDVGDLYTTVSYDPPQGFYTRATGMYFKRGQLGLSPEGVVKIIASPVKQLVVANVAVSIEQAPPNATIEEHDYSPVLERTVFLHTGGVTVHTETFHDYCVVGADSSECTDCKFMGAPAARIESELKGGKCEGDSSVIKIVSDRVVALGGCVYYRNEVWTKA
jgi:hypothetical protein